VALPVDQILNDAVNIMERYIGHEPQVVERLQRILRNARDVKQAITKVGEKMSPAKAVPASLQENELPQLRGVRVLVVDADDSVRGAAHALLERMGCVVETAHNGVEAVSMVRGSPDDAAYNVIICDLRLPDMSAYGLLCKLQTVMETVPLVLMSGYGYDPGHTLVKCRQAGLHPKAVLFKPFRRDQLLEVIEMMLDPAKAIPGTPNEAPAPAVR
jgi:two-component system, sensor histidine kinase SagS